MIYGKVIGGLLGLLAGGPFGLLLGVAVGHWFDCGLRHSAGPSDARHRGAGFGEALRRGAAFGDPQRRARAQRVFFDTSFLLLGRLAKADGRVSEEEIAHAEDIIRRLGANEEQRREAIAQFQRGARSDFAVEPALARFKAIFAGQRQPIETLLSFLVSMAAADGYLHPAEKTLLRHVADSLGYGRANLQRLLDMLEAQARFHQGRQRPASRRGELAEAYQALGVPQSCDDRELKRAYRKLMSANHPDKLIARGVPENMVKLATERSQEIQAAYETVKRHREAAA